MKYGYIRVSSKSQKTDGNSLEAQMDAVKNAGAVKVFVEAYTGVKLDRPEFSKLMEIVKQDDTIIVTKMDRFARTVAQATETITSLSTQIYLVNFLSHIVFKFSNICQPLLVRSIC